MIVKVYRRLNICDRLKLDMHGRCPLEALSPGSETSIVGHLLDGSKLSKFIATCKTIEAIQKWMELELQYPKIEEKVVEIDVAELTQNEHIEILDLTDTRFFARDEGIPKTEIRRAKRLADELQTVFIVGRIPRQYVQLIPLVQISPREIEIDRVYRRLRRFECSRVELCSKNEYSDRSVLDHISDGSHRGSQFISCCRSMAAMERWVAVGCKGPREGTTVTVVEIDVKRLLAEHTDVRLIDMSVQDTMKEYIPSTELVSRTRASRYEEVLLVGRIGPEYLKEVSGKW